MKHGGVYSGCVLAMSDRREMATAGYRQHSTGHKQEQCKKKLLGIIEMFFFVSQFFSNTDFVRK